MPIENTSGLNDFGRETNGRERKRFLDRFDPIELRTYLKIGGLILASGIVVGYAINCAADYFWK